MHTFLGTPAGMTTTSTPSKAWSSLSAAYPLTYKIHKDVRNNPMSCQSSQKGKATPGTKTTHLTASIDVSDISSDTRSTADIVKAQAGDQRISLEEKRERLSDSTASTEDGDFSVSRGSCRECAGIGTSSGAEGGAREHDEERIRERYMGFF